MKLEKNRTLAICCLVLSCFAWTITARAASPSAEQALKLVPIQKDGDFDQPDAEQASKCKITARKTAGRVGWVVEDPDGLILRRFTDTNGDNVVDQWSYFKDGLEVYRDIDANFNGKADQCRWFNTAGCRWGLDKNEDGTIDDWQVISAEEVTAEAVAALAAGDSQRFARLVLTPAELKELSLGAKKAEELAKKLRDVVPQFKELAAKQKAVTSASRWVQFSASRPGIVPAGTEGSSRDLRVYENVLAVVQTGDKHGQVMVGTLIRVDNLWRLIDVPQPVAEGEADLANDGFFFRTPLASQPNTPAAGAGAQSQKLLAALETLDRQAAEATSPEAKSKAIGQRADLLEDIAAKADSAADRAMWMRQLADMLSAAVQSGSYADGTKRLESLFKTLSADKQDKDLAAYVKFRLLTAEYGQKLLAPKPDYGKIQDEWLASLKQYVGDYPASPDAAEAMLQLAMTEEFSGNEDAAKQWYAQITKSFPSVPAAKKAAGAQARLNSVGKLLSLKGKTSSGKQLDLAKYRGRVVLIHYWATWSEPCKTDIAILKELATKYGGSGFSVIGISLDGRLQDLSDYLSENSLPWPQVFEEGGLDSRLANDLGIVTVPTMILVDKEGKVLSRSLQASEIERELKKHIRVVKKSTTRSRSTR